MPSLSPLTLQASEQQTLPASISPLLLRRPLLLIGHGSRDADGRQRVLDLAQTYEALDRSRPVIPCFLELTGPSIQDGVDRCVELGYTDLSALPVLLFAARHNKFDVTGELDRARQRHPQVTFHYGRHFGIAPEILQLWRDRLTHIEQPQWNPREIDRKDTVLLFVGRGASDPDANGDVFKLARMIWEGSGYATVETCFIGITHPRLEEGFRRARLYNPKRIIVLPYFLFTGVLMKKIFEINAQQQSAFPEIETLCLPEMGLHPKLFEVMRRRELETQTDQVQMNCEMCKFRLAAMPTVDGVSGPIHEHEHAHGDSHGQLHEQPHGHHHGHHHHHGAEDSYAEPQQYHERAWQVP